MQPIGSNEEDSHLVAEPCENQMRQKCQSFCLIYDTIKFGILKRLIFSPFHSFFVDVTKDIE